VHVMLRALHASSLAAVAHADLYEGGSPGLTLHAGGRVAVQAQDTLRVPHAADVLALRQMGPYGAGTPGLRLQLPPLGSQRQVSFSSLQAAAVCVLLQKCRNPAGAPGLRRQLPGGPDAQLASRSSTTSATVQQRRRMMSSLPFLPRSEGRD